MNPRLMTLHTHSDFSDGRASLAEMFAAFTGAGFTHVAFADHYASEAAGRIPGRLNEKSVHAYLHACSSCGIAAGLEVEIIGGVGPAIQKHERELAAFTLGGLHHLRGVRFFDDPTAIQDAHAYVRHLAEALLGAMGSGLLDAVAHPTKLPDSIRPYAGDLLDSSWRAPLIEAAARHAIAFDVNEDSRVPDASFIADCRQAGVKLLIGSDAHTVAEACLLEFVGEVCDAAAVVDSDLYLPRQQAELLG